MPLKSRATQARAARAENDLDRNVAPRAGADLNPAPRRDPEPEAQTPPETKRVARQEPSDNPPETEQPKRKPRVQRAPKAVQTVSTPVTKDGVLDKKAVRARLKQIETDFKSLASEEKVAVRNLIGEFAAKRSALKNEHAKLSAQLSAAAFGQ